MVDTRQSEFKTCIGLYHAIWQYFGEDEFEAADLLSKYQQQPRRYIPSSDTDLEEFLCLLVACGLLTRTADQTYRLQRTPQETEQEWREHFADRAGSLYEAVHSLPEGRSENEVDDRLITYRGHTYTSLFIDEGMTSTELMKQISEVSEKGLDHEGLALRCPANRSEEAQRLADELTTSPEEPSLPTFEKVNTEVKGADSTELEFRLYITPND